MTPGGQRAKTESTENMSLGDSDTLIIRSSTVEGGSGNSINHIT